MTLLGPEMRRILEPRFDLPALDEFLRTMSPERRAVFLPELAGDSLNRSEETRDVRFTLRTSDPAQQRLIDRAWRPYWLMLPTEVRNRRSEPIPGRAAREAEEVVPRAKKP